MSQVESTSNIYFAAAGIMLAQMLLATVGSATTLAGESMRRGSGTSARFIFGVDQAEAMPNISSARFSSSSVSSNVLSSPGAEEQFEAVIASLKSFERTSMSADMAALIDGAIGRTNKKAGESADAWSNALAADLSKFTD